MGNPLFNKFGGNPIPGNSGNGFGNILSQFRMLQNDPGKILDILYQNGKISQQQYNELQPVRNNPQQIVNYLSQNGNENQFSEIMKQLK